MRWRIRPGSGIVDLMENVVLIAVADSSRLTALVDGLTAEGFHCLTAATGSEALATASSYAPQVAVLHTELPDVQGTDVCLRLKQESSTEKIVVLLIGKDATEERFVGNEVGADAYLPEPYTERALFDKVRALFQDLIAESR